jgi:hypothetical protein
VLFVLRALRRLPVVDIFPAPFPRLGNPFDCRMTLAGW